MIAQIKVNNVQISFEWVIPSDIPPFSCSLFLCYVSHSLQRLKKLQQVLLKSAYVDGLFTSEEENYSKVLINANILSTKCEKWNKTPKNGSHNCSLSTNTDFRFKHFPLVQQFSSMPWNNIQPHTFFQETPIKFCCNAHWINQI